jgi:hypothetical protein
VVTPNSETVVWVDDDFNSGTLGWGISHFATINDGIQAVATNGTVNVYPGAYVETAAGSYLYDLSGPIHVRTVPGGRWRDRAGR